jgi:hypothetical protein
MKIRFIKTVLVEVMKPRLEETWDKEYRKWEELKVDSIIGEGNRVNITTSQGDILLDVPLNSFEYVVVNLV